MRVPIVRAEIADTLRAFRAAAVSIVALMPREGQPLFESDFRKPTGFLVGGEGPGIPADVVSHVDQRISIPMCEPVESLNVGVAAALVLYEAFRQRRQGL